MTTNSNVHLTAEAQTSTADAPMTTPQPDLTTLAASGTQPGWLVLDAARTHQFTGEIFVTAPITAHVYFDHGLAYHAERPADPSLCERLLSAEVVTPVQVERGVVRVGNIENLGRLFDRDPSVDRDAVMVVVELATDEVVTEIANHGSIEFSPTAYRHHASGVHRWFVAPSDPTQLSPVGEVAQIDGSITSDLPTVSTPPTTVEDDVHIEWTSTIDGSAADRGSALHSLDDAILQSLLDDEADSGLIGFDPDNADWSQRSTATPSGDPAIVEFDSAVEITPVESSDDDFQILWPDGTEEELPTDAATPSALVDDTLFPSPSIDTAAAPDVSAAAADLATPDVPAAAHDVFQLAPSPAQTAPSDAVDAPDPTETLPAAAATDADAAESDLTSDLSFAMPTLQLDADDVPTDEQPDEVVDAVRRALDAIESASVSKPALSSMTLAPLSHVATASADTPSNATAPAAPVVAATPFAGFAPPTMEDSAEAIYARMAEAGQTATPAAAGTDSVVFVDDGDDGERSGALRRLIGSLRRK